MEDFAERIDRMANAIPKYAKAKAERVYIEQFRKSKKALLMSQCDASTSAAREQYAYAHPEYRQLLEGLRDAVEYEEKCKWALERFRMEFEHWRTIQANDRYLKDRV